MKKKQDFYSSLDDSRVKREKKSSCSVLSLSIFFIILLVAMELGLYFIARSFKSNQKNENSVAPTLQLETRGNSFDLGDNRFSLSISQGILCSSIQKTSNIENLNCAIDEEGIEISGKLSPFLPKNSKIILVPTLEDGRVVFKVKKLSIGLIRVPSFMARQVASALSDALYSTFPDLEKSQVEKVELQEAVMTITAKKQ